MARSSVARKKLAWRAVGSLALLLGGCTTAGNQWVRETHSPVWSSDRENPPSLDLPPPEETVAERRPRLREVMTLGESYAAPEPDEPPAPSSSGGDQHQRVTVQVNNYNQVMPYGFGYGYGAPGWYGSRTTGWGGRSGHSGTSSSRATSTRGQSPRIGQDWPAIPDHGPKFPFPSAPGNPWQYEN